MHPPLSHLPLPSFPVSISKADCIPYTPRPHSPYLQAASSVSSIVCFSVFHVRYITGPLVWSLKPYSHVVVDVYRVLAAMSCEGDIALVPHSTIDELFSHDKKRHAFFTFLSELTAPLLAQGDTIFMSDDVIQRMIYPFFLTPGFDGRVAEKLDRVVTLAARVSGVLPLLKDVGIVVCDDGTVLLVIACVINVGTLVPLIVFGMGNSLVDACVQSLDMSMSMLACMVKT